jgi:hypothetical protein
VFSSAFVRVGEMSGLDCTENLIFNMFFLNLKFARYIPTNHCLIQVIREENTYK